MEGQSAGELEVVGVVEEALGAGAEFLDGHVVRGDPLLEVVAVEALFAAEVASVIDVHPDEKGLLRGGGMVDGAAVEGVSQSPFEGSLEGVEDLFARVHPDIFGEKAGN